MASLFASGGIVDAILLVVVLEAAALIWYRHRTGRGLPAPDLLAMLAAGACLMLALRAALVGAAWPWIALWLAGSLAGHLLDLARRWRRLGGDTSSAALNRSETIVRDRIGAQTAR